MKDYASSSFDISIHNEQAIILAKGTLEKPDKTLTSVLSLMLFCKYAPPGPDMSSYVISLLI
ncbi:MAG: hypothetical protein AB2821_09175 [Candidatus Thiodiazotropha endolucinida]